MRNRITVAKTNYLVHWEENSKKHEEKDHIPCVNRFSHFKKQTQAILQVSGFAWLLKSYKVTICLKKKKVTPTSRLTINSELSTE